MKNPAYTAATIQLATSNDLERNNPETYSNQVLGSTENIPYGATSESLHGNDNPADHLQLSSPDLARESSILDNDEQQPTAAALAVDTAQTPKKVDKPVTWMSLPKKGQLAVLTLARLAEPLSERSLTAYMFFMLRSYNPSLPDSTIAYQGGLLTAAFAGAQFVTAVWWGRAADSARIGRKRVILVGLLGACIATIGIGFSTSFTQVFALRILAGALNGNVGVLRTMISEIIEDRKFQSRAFLLLPMCFNIGVIIGPILGGFLAEPVTSFPGIFGPGSKLGGQDGVRWMTAFPYALPNIVSAFFLLAGVLAVILGLDETHCARRDKLDWGRNVGKFLFRHLFKKDAAYAYRPLGTDETELQNTPLTSDFPHTPGAQQDTQFASRHTPAQEPARSPNLPGSGTRSKSFLYMICTPNILLTLLAHHLLALHISTFNALIFLFLPLPRHAATEPPLRQLPFRFTGGLGLSAEKVGLATAIIGIIGFPLQLLVYPGAQTRLGTLRSFKTFLPFSALAYVTLPFLAIFANNSFVVWPALAIVLGSQVLSRTFSLPSMVILVNNSSPSKEVLGTVHGVAQSVSSAARMLGPTAGGWLLGLGQSHNLVGGVWWLMAAVVGVNWTMLWLIWEGDGQGGKS